MGRLRGSILGKPNGKVGDIVFRNLHGNVLICSEPTSYSMPMDDASITRRTKFRFVVKLSSAIIKLLSLRILWDRSAGRQKAGFNKVFSSNYKRINGNNVSSVILSERPGFGVSGPEITIAANTVTLNLDPLGDQADINPLVETKLSAEGVLYLSSPIDINDAPYSFVPLSSEDINTNLVNPLVLVANVPGPDAIDIPKYQTKKVLLTLVTKNAAGFPVQSSVTFSN